MTGAVPSVAALVPCPPLLVPELAGGAATELDDLRTACLRALDEVVAAGTVLAVAAGPGLGVARPGTRGSLQPFGVPLDVALPAVAEVVVGDALQAGAHGASFELAVLPPALTVLAWLLQRAQRPPRRLAAVTVPVSLRGQDAVAIGRRLGQVLAGGPFGVVAVGDLSARRTLKAPGTLDARAAAHDAGIVRLLRDGDLEGVIRIPEGPAAELLADARAPLQVMAGALGAPSDHMPPANGRILYDQAPYGVGYVVALLHPAPPGPRW